ncbi:MAG: hypothetical protein VKJ06_04210 [Vampirovibrionales bacterium]|nr:hypothetical protein [Vampirovibrionales bacterium]
MSSISASLAPSLRASNAALPWPVQLDRNKFFGRVAIENILYAPLQLAAARNKYERIELLLDNGMWLAMGVAMPVLTDRYFSRWYSAQLRKAFKLPAVPANQEASKSLLHIPFEWLASTGQRLTNAQGHIVPELLADAEAMAQKVGLEGASQLAKLINTPAFCKKLQLGKVGLMWLGLGLMAAKGQLYNASKNVLTEKLSGQKGFVGEFNYTNEAFRKQEAQEFYAHAHRRALTSLALGATGAGLFPLGVLATLRGWNGFKRFAPLLKKINYTDAIFMPKAVFFVHTLFNYNMPSLMFSRGPNELREKLIKCLSFDFFYYLGDDLIAGTVAKHLQKAKQLGQQLVTGHKKVLGLAIPHPKPLVKVYEEALTLAKGSAALASKTPLYKAGLTSYLAGLFGTSVALGLTVPLFNNWFTHKKVTQEKQAQAQSLPQNPVIAKPTFSPIARLNYIPPAPMLNATNSYFPASSLAPSLNYTLQAPLAMPLFTPALGAMPYAPQQRYIV